MKRLLQKLWRYGLWACFVLNSSQLDSAEFRPLVDGWMISESIPLGGTVYRDNFDIASCGEEYLVAWEQFDQDLGSVSIFGVVIDADGNVLSDTRFEIVAQENSGTLGIRAASDGIGYFVVWRTANDDGDTRLRATRVSRSGAVADPAGIELRRQTYPVIIQNEFDVESNGSHYLIAWGERNSESASADQSSWTIYSLRVDARGQIEEQSPTVLAKPAAVDVSISKGIGGSFRAIGAVGDFSLTTTIDVAADGSVLGIAEDFPPNNPFAPAIAFNGIRNFAAWTQYSSDFSAMSMVGSLLPTQLSNAQQPIKQINSAHEEPLWASVASDGDGFFVAWTEERPASPRGKLFGTRVSSTGDILDPDSLPIDIESGVHRGKLASNGRNYLIAIMNNKEVGRQLTARLIINPENYPTLLSAPGLKQNGSASFQFNAAPGASFEVQYSDDLTEWKERETFLNFSGEATVTDPNSSPTGQRFYRAKKLNP